MTNIRLVPDDPVERGLRDDAARHLDDDGFTAKVMAGLPEKRAARPAWLRPAILLTGTAAGALLAAILLPTEESVVRGAFDLATGAGLTPAAMVAIAASGLVAVIAAVTANSAE
jgi:hypothetical protein